MADNNRSRDSLVPAFLLGAVVGAGLALLFAPRDGEAVQQGIRRQAKRLGSAAGRTLREAGGGIKEIADRTLEGVRDSIAQRAGSREGVDEEARKTRAELEAKLERTKARRREDPEQAASEGEAPVPAEA